MYADLDRPEKGSNVLGSTIKNPAKSCDYVEEPGSSYIISSGRTIKVKCNVAEEKCTCLSIKGELIEESAINGLAVTLGDQLWLSQTTYDEQSLYNNIEGITGTDIPQISHLLSTSVKVSQRIRYYYSAGNTTTAEDANVKTLKALLWNDQLVGSEITKQMPINFTVSGTEPCWDENTEWMCTNIIFKTQSNNRLPVKDFYIKEVRIKSPGVPDSAVPETGAPKDAPIQKLYFQLTDLCFFYN
nr:uncharacterized protein LOC117986123 [Maniola hyperantus]